MQGKQGLEQGSQAKPSRKEKTSLYPRSDIKEILEKEGIKDFKKDIRTMPKKELIKNFRFKTKRKVNPTKLIKNLVWQAYIWIGEGKMDPIEGNLRSFWYQNVKYVLSRVVKNVNSKSYMTKVYDCFVEMVTVHNLFRYADFGFDDVGEGLRVIGKENANLILFAEKMGLQGIIKRAAKANNATGVASDGFPSYLATEYLVRKMASLGLLTKPVHLFLVVDYDPAGYWIGKEFQKQLENYKVEVASAHSLIVPEVLSKEELELRKYKIKHSSRAKNWHDLTGGIDGELYGLGADIGGKRIRQLLAGAMVPYLSKPGKSSRVKSSKSGRASKARQDWLDWLAAEPDWKNR